MPNGDEIFPFCYSHLFSGAKVELEAVPSGIIPVGVLEVLNMSIVNVDPKEPDLIFHPLSAYSVLPAIYVVIRVVTKVFDQCFALVSNNIRSLANGTEVGRLNYVPIGFDHANIELLFRVKEMSKYEIETDEIEVIVVNWIVPYISGKCPVSKIGSIGVMF